MTNLPQDIGNTLCLRTSVIVSGLAWAAGSARVAAADVFDSRFGPWIFGQEGDLGVEDQQPVVFLDPIADLPREGALIWNLVPRA